LRFKRFGRFHALRGNNRTPVSARILPLLLDDAQRGLKHHNVSIDHAVIAGWTGRDAAAVEKHIKELEVLGVKPPATTPFLSRRRIAAHHR
jgi:hypothetical protein